MAVLEIPVRNDAPAYRFQIVLEDKIYFLEFSFNSRMGRWLMDIENESQEPLILGIVMFEGISLVDGYTSNELPPGFFVCIDLANKRRHPDRENFGGDLKLYYQESANA